FSFNIQHSKFKILFYGGAAMKIAFVIYRDIYEDRVSTVLEKAGVDFYTEWENVKGKGHKTIPHLGTRAFPGYNNVRMIAFEDECQLEEVARLLREMNAGITMKDDLARMFQIPLEKVI
ncbi:MAG: PG0541 family transporter-associated protein, partial [Bacteroidota bacterium]